MKSHLRNKRDPCWVNDFEIVEKPAGRFNSYRIRNLKNGLLMPANGDHLKVNHSQMEMILNREYEIEEILGHRDVLENGKRHRIYRVKWAGYNEISEVYDTDMGDSNSVRDEYDGQVDTEMTTEIGSLSIRDRTKWRLNPVIFAKLLRLFPELEIDLFANSENRQLPVYCSLEIDQQSYGNAWDVNWSRFEWLYANPPFDEISKVLDRFVEQGKQLVLVVPWYG